MTDTNNKQLLAENTKNLVEQIAAENDPTKVKDLVDLFKLNQQKRDLCRIERLNNLQDMIDAELQTRLECYAYAVSNKDLIAMLNATNNTVSNTKQALEQQPIIQINNQEINVNSPASGLNLESRQRVIQAVTEILKNSSQNKEESDIISVDAKEVK